MNKMNVSMVIVAFSMIWGVQAQKSAGKVNPAAATQKTVGVADSLIKPILGQVNFNR
ncbi:MAG: hypothetical protein RL233_1761 [Bacteroidota bacterium]